MTSYVKQTWNNGSAGATPLSAARLQYIEDGLEAVDITMDGKQNSSDAITLTQVVPGAMIAIDYYKAVYGAAIAWPAARPSSNANIMFVWIGPTDPGSIMLAGDAFWLDA